jgi:hypothetical protein
MSLASIDSNSIIRWAPKDVLVLIANDFSIKDLATASRVCKTWHKVFSSDDLWKGIAKQLGAQKVDRGLILSCLGTCSIIRYLPGNIRKYFLNDYKSIVKEFLIQKKMNEMAFIEVKCGIELLNIFGNAQPIQRLPAVDVFNRELINDRYFDQKHYIAPLTRARFWKNNDEVFFFLLLRGRNNKTREPFYEAIHISYNPLFRKRIFSASFTPPEHRMITGQSINVTQSKLDRLKRFIQHKPVGTLLEDNETEGPRLRKKRTILQLV